MGRGTIVFILGMLAILIALLLAYFFVLSQPDIARKIVEDAPQKTLPSMLSGTLRRTNGVVEIQVPNQPWKKALEGAPMKLGDRVRTGPQGFATFSYGEGLQVQVQKDSQVQLQQINDQTVRFNVHSGLVIIDVDQSKTKRVVQLAADQSDAIVETRDGRVAMLSDAKGQVQTAVTRGEATLFSGGKQIKLRAGEQSLVRKGKEPSAPTAIPETLLLKVKWPSAGTRKRRHLIVGQTSPGNLVWVGDQVVSADAAGHFQALIKLHEGRNKVVVRTMDVTARQKENEQQVSVDTKAPALKVQTDPSIWDQ